ncbi:MAG: MBOAT family O-acyltransferase, partial [Limisphaerales bacterium]
MLALCAWGSLRWRNASLAAGSLLFYAWDYTPYVGVLGFSIGLNFVVGLKAGPDNSARMRKTALWLGIIGNLLVLGHYKYTGFLVENLNPVVVGLGYPELPVPIPNMPLGISFFTFQAMSYVVDVYRGKTQVQRNLVDLTLYISLFPQLIAGPIVRYHEVARQIYIRNLTNRGFSIGVYRFIIGLSKKLLIADTLAQPAEIVFALSLDELTTPLAWTGLLCFTLQIYFDFSGYSDMAIGMGRMFGFKIPENFNYPYISQSVTEFWRRWHMTLSRWFRDYLYIPLGGNR